MIFFDNTDQRKPEKNISQNPKIIQQYREHEVKQSDEIILGGCLREIGMFLHPVAHSEVLQKNLPNFSYEDGF
jgi:hypothetical protein